MTKRGFTKDPIHGRRRPRAHDEKHLDWIRGLPSLISGVRTGIEAAHVRFGSPRDGKRSVGMSEKPDDRWAVPLSDRLHRLDKDAQHAGNERQFWEKHGIDVCRVALALAGCSGDDQLGEVVIAEANAGAR